MLDASSALSALPMVALDTETTGASAAMGHRVIELGMVRIEGGRVVDRFTQLFDPLRPLSPTITWITGITPDMLIGQPRFGDCLPRALEMLRGAVLLGHNVAFDLSFLARELRVAGMAIEQVLAGSVVLDTLKLARRRFGRGGNSLPLLAARLGVEVAVSHRALADAETTAGVLHRFLEPMGGWATSLADLCEAQGGAVPLVSRSSQSLLPLELQEALELAVPVVMEYVDARSQLSCRTIEPRYVRRRRGELCLVAFCRLRNAERTFRIDRIVGLKRLDAATAGDAGESVLKPSAVAAPPHSLLPAPAVTEDLMAGSPASSQGSDRSVSLEAVPLLEPVPAGVAAAQRS